MCKRCPRYNPFIHFEAPLASLLSLDAENLQVWTLWLSHRKIRIATRVLRFSWTSAISVLPFQYLVLFSDRLSRMAHLAAVPYTTDGKGTEKLFVDRAFCQAGLLLAIFSDQDLFIRLSFVISLPGSLCSSHF